MYRLYLRTHLTLTEKMIENAASREPLDEANLSSTYQEPRSGSQRIVVRCPINHRNIDLSTVPFLQPQRLTSWKRRDNIIIMLILKAA
jgi:hypothetical protein